MNYCFNNQANPQWKIPLQAFWRKYQMSEAQYWENPELIAFARVTHSVLILSHFFLSFFSLLRRVNPNQRSHSSPLPLTYGQHAHLHNNLRGWDDKHISGRNLLFTAFLVHCKKPYNFTVFNSFSSYKFTRLFSWKLCPRTMYHQQGRKKNNADNSMEDNDVYNFWLKKSCL